MHALDDLGGQSADLNTDEGAEQHADSQGVEDVAVDGVLTDGGEAGGKDDLENISADGGHGRDTEGR